jgi:hypothetical protein
MYHKQNWPILKTLHLGGQSRTHRCKLGITLPFFREGKYTRHQNGEGTYRRRKGGTGRPDGHWRGMWWSRFRRRTGSHSYAATAIHTADDCACGWDVWHLKSDKETAGRKHGDSIPWTRPRLKYRLCERGSISSLRLCWRVKRRKE